MKRQEWLHLCERRYIESVNGSEMLYPRYGVAFTAAIAISAAHYWLFHERLTVVRAENMTVAELACFCLSFWASIHVIWAIIELYYSIAKSGQFRYVALCAEYQRWTSRYISKLTNSPYSYSEAMAGDIAHKELEVELRKAYQKYEAHNRQVAEKRLGRYNSALKNIIVAALLAVIHAIFASLSLWIEEFGYV